MKKIIVFTVCMVFLLLSACGSSNVEDAASYSISAANSVVASTDVEVPPSNETAKGDSIAAVQNSLDGIVQLNPDYRFIVSLVGEPNYDNPAAEETALFRQDDDGNLTLLVDGLRGNGSVWIGKDGRLFLNNDGTIYLFDEQSESISPVADGRGYGFGDSRWFGDDNYIYTTYYLQSSEHGRDFNIVKINLSDGNVTVLPNTTGIEPFDSFGNELVYINYDPNVTEVFTLDVNTNTTSSLGIIDDWNEGSLCGGVFYTFEVTASRTIMHATNLITGETGQLAFDVNAEMWIVERIDNGILAIRGFADGGDILLHLDLETGSLI